MNDNTNNSAGSAADNGSTGGQPDYKALYEKALTELETAQKRFAGLQRTYQGERAKWEADAAKLADLEVQLKAVIGDKEKLALDIESLNKKLAEATRASERSQAQLERLRLISSFPSLLPLEAEGLLPDGSGDELKKKLEKLVQAIAAKGKADAEALLKGQAPSSPRESKPDKPEELKRAAFAAQIAGRIDEYNSLMDQYYQVISRS